MVGIQAQAISPHKLANDFKQARLTDTTFESIDELAGTIAELRRLSFYEKCSLVISPTNSAAGAFYTRIPDTSFSLSRASSTTRINRDGVVESVAASNPRIDYSSGYAELSIEPQRTNLLLHSEALDNAVYAKTNATITPDAIAAPTGLLTADTLFETVTNGVHGFTQTVTKSASAIQYAISIRVKLNGRNWIALYGANSSNSAGKWFNILTGELGNDRFTGAGFTLQSSGIVPLADGWFRCYVVITTTATTSISVSCITSNDGVTTGFAGDITKGVHFGGIQLEAGDLPTSYIATAASTVTRVSDTIASKTDINTAYDLAEGTMFFDGSVIHLTNGSAKCLLGISDGSTDNRILLYASGTTSEIVFDYRRAAVPQASILTGVAIATGARLKVAAVWDTVNNYAALFVNGVKIGEDLSVTAIAAANRIVFHNGAGTSPFFGKIRSACISKKRISDAEAIAQTTL